MKTIQVPRRFVSSDWGGTETVVFETSRALMGAGHDTQIFTSLALSKERQESFDGVPIRRFPYCYPFFGLSEEDIDTLDRKGGNLLSLSLLWALLRESNVELMHAHTGKRLGAVVRTAARMRGIPYVITLHGGQFDVPTEEAAQIIDPIRDRVEWGKPFGALLGSRRVLDDAAAIVCVGLNEATAAQEQLPHQRVHFVPNGVDSVGFSAGDGPAFRALYRIPVERKLILCVGRIDYQKNQIGLVSAISTLVGQGHDLHLALVGPVTIASYHDRLVRALDEAGMNDRVTVIPGLEPSDPMLVNAYHASDVFCLPSLHEPFGIVVLEAWAAGRAVVAADVGGLSSFTVDGENAVHVDPQDPHSVVQGLRVVLEDPALAARIAHNGQATAKSQFDWSQIAQQMLEIYEDVAA
ncbi:MAG: glycosyltransferase family 4 protein [Pseudomonadota bacterium]